MNPLTHVLAGWAAANLAPLDRRGRAAVTLAGVIPDMDGLGLIAEELTKDSVRPLTWWSDYHHVVSHNLAFGLLVAAACAWSAKARRGAVAALAFLSFHVHVLCDIAGAGGPDGEHWPIPYLWPFTSRVMLEWRGQWLINAWQNVVITALLLCVVFYIAWRRGYSPLEMVSARADAALVGAVRGRFPVGGQPRD
ncbi:MAG: metal-dependent hydrolase [Nitrospirae bacterium]|nr:metal-dependent hydrolase [Nitrospirota bacterium]